MDRLDGRDLTRYSEAMFSVGLERNCRKTIATRQRQTVGSIEGRQFRSSRVKHQIGRDLFCSIGLSLLVLFAVQKEFYCLRISSIVIPPAILNGSETTLVCNYELGPSDQLYSVTWYKDRVGFYRYQSASDAQDQTTTTAGLEQQEQNLNLNHQSHHQSVPPPVTTNAKHEFDWAGISLDLARSNSTHVHLKQVGLNSEGTFECEVIADAPTFATVSASRQMKVYVLPKRKLSLVDNSQQAASVQSAPQTNHQNHDQQHQLFKQNIYQLNDLLNFTCIAGPSRPAARLSWLLNDMPISSLQPTISNKPSEELQEQLQISGSNQTTTMRSTDSLTETKSTLVLRLQASHLRHLQSRTNQMQNQQQQQQRSSNNRGSSYLPLKLSCVFELSVEFTSNTSLFISGGKTSTTTKRSRTPLPVVSVETPQPEASSWRSKQGLTTTNPRRRPDPGNDEQELMGYDDVQDEGRDSVAQDTQTHQDAVAKSIYRWPPSASRQRPRLFGADYDQMTSVAPPSGLETNYLAMDTTSGELARRPARQLIVWTNRQLKDQSDFIERLLPRSNANELEPAHIEAQTVESATRVSESAAKIPQTETDSLSSSSSSSEWLYSRLPESQDSAKTNKDFELYELVNFTCHQEDRSGTERMHSIQLKWFLNDQEVVGDLVNAFEPARGFYFDPNESLSKRPVDRHVEQQDGKISNHHLWLGPTSTTKTSRSLLIEFSQNLFRLKELNLRCKTIVDQPLIEIENYQLLYLATSPFIQAQDQQQHPGRPSLYNVNSRHRQQQHRPIGQRHQQPLGTSSSRQHQGNVIRMRPQSSRTSSSASSSSISKPTLFHTSTLSHIQWLLIVFVTYFCFYSCQQSDRILIRM